MTTRRGIIPAYAGSTSRWCSRRRLRADHPRIRGEHVVFSLDPHFRIGSSPHTRGARQPPERQYRGRRIIPAYAGSTGDAFMLTTSGWGSSPHTRGARLHRQDERVARGIIPAYAGSTESDVSGAVEVEDHPRIRGEHAWSPATVSSAFGSSPHTRGALRGDDAPQERVGDHPRIRGEHGPSGTLRCHCRRIIPAYAGST